MGAIQGQTLNQGQTTLEATTGYSGDPGDGTTKWFHWFRTANGGDAAQGSTTDVAVTAVDATPGTVIGLLKGVGTRLASVITALGVGASSLLKAEDAAHASGDAGVMALVVRQDTAAALAGTTGDYQPMTTDLLGRLRVRTRYDEVDVTTARTTALAASLVVKASAGKLYGFQGYASSAGFVLVHNTTSVPADTSVPAEVIPVEAGKPFSLDFGVRGLPLGTGITLVHSSTGPTKTISGSVMWVSAQYE